MSRFPLELLVVVENARLLFLETLATRRLLAALILALGILPLAAPSASAAVAASVESRASGAALGLTTLIEIETRLSEEAVRENRALSYDLASDDAVAARATTRVKPPLQTPERIIVDSRGNAIPLNSGESITRSPDGKWVQVRDANGNPTGMRMDGPHSPRTHSDPRALQPHGHVPGVTNADGTPWLPIK